MELLHTRTPTGYTTIELVVALCIIGILASTALLTYSHIRDGIAVNSATDEIVTILGTARQVARAQSRNTTILIKDDPATLSMILGDHQISAREIGSLYGVKLKTNRSSVTYAPNGFTTGVANFTLTISKGRAADTISMSRLGRVKRS